MVRLSHPFARAVSLWKRGAPRRRRHRHTGAQLREGGHRGFSKVGRKPNVPWERALGGGGPAPSPKPHPPDSSFLTLWGADVRHGERKLGHQPRPALVELRVDYQQAV